MFSSYVICCLVRVQGCHGQGKISGKYLENDFFPGQGKVREFCGWPAKFKKDLENQDKSGNLKINGYGRQTSKNLFILFKR